MIFIFDIVSGVASSFLFFSCADASSIFTLISVDMLENMSLALKVVGLVQKSSDEALKREGGARDRQIAELEQEQMHLKRQQERQGRKFSWLHKRVKRLEGEENVSDNAGDVSMENDNEGNSETTLLKNENEDKPYLIGKENLLLSRAARRLLAFFASEFSEMVSACWALILLPFIYLGPNKSFLYTIEDMDDDAFKQAMLFSGIDFAMELITFLVMLLIFHLHLKIHVLTMGIVNLNEKKFLLPLLALCFMVMFGGGCFLIKHFGMDPTFKFDEFTS
ncbi:hypothetical protein TrLO_g13512 [Triparma laevis f. longispina]|uniref:Uncharacterized protein n=1 Tax=Triparma laevis f. longispina TaxID=1714387 RepID=A0A9W7FQI9_9STRA|nr:hypothetical protein TrLO_g13512 [Triparma laevis f. longispina]